MINVNEFMKGLGKQVRFHRMKAGLTQVQLANMAGVGKTTVFDIQFSGPLSMEYEKSLECENN